MAAELHSGAEDEADGGDDESGGEKPGHAEHDALAKDVEEHHQADADGGKKELHDSPPSELEPPERDLT